MNTLDKINTDNLTGEITSVHPQDVFFSMGIDRDPDAMSLTPHENKYSIADAIEGSFKQNFFNVTRGAVKFAERQITRDPNYNPFNDPQLEERGKDFILAHQDGLSSVSTPEDMTETLKTIDDTQKINEAIGEHPIAGFATMLLASAPEAIAMVLPGAAATSLLVKTASFAASGALYGAASTLGSQQLNATASNQDVFDNSAMGAVLGAGLPLFFHGLNKIQMRKAVDFMGGKVKNPNALPQQGELPDVMSQLPNSPYQSAGAASTRLDEFGELDVVPSKAITYDKALDKIIPKNSALSKDSTIAQKIEYLDKLQEQGSLSDRSYQKIKEAINNNEPVYEPTLSGKAFIGAKKFIAKFAPAQRASLSDSATMRQWGNETYINNTTKNKNTEGYRSQNSIFMDHEAAVSNQQMRFNNGLTKAAADEGVSLRTPEDNNIFMKKVVDDLMTNKKTPGANFLREFNNDYAKKINEKKILKDGALVDENGNYFTGSLSRDKIASDPKGFMDMTKAKVEKDRMEASAKLDELVKSTVARESAALEETPGKVRETGKLLKPGEEKRFDPYAIQDLDVEGKIAYLKKSKHLNPEEVDTLPEIAESLLSKDGTDEIARDVMNKFLNPDGYRQLPRDGGGGEVKAKTINYTYQEAKKYLPENLIAAQTKYIRNLELKFTVKDRYGVDTSEYVSTINQKITADYEPLIANAKDGAEVKRLTDAAERDKKQVKDTFDILSKKYDIPHSAAGVVMRNVAKLARMWQATRMLGLAAIANMPDLSNLAGLKNALWLGKGISEGLEHMGRVNLSKEEAEFMHLTMSELAPTNAAMELIGADANGALTENMGKLDKAVATLDKGQRAFFKVSGFNWFVNTERQIAGSFIADKILKAAQALEAGTLKQGTKEFNDLHKFGIDRHNVKEIMNEVRTHGVTKEGFLGNKYLYPNVHEWTPSVGVDFTSKMLREVENAVTAKTVGDAPFWTNTAWGGMFTQFKGWQFGSLNRQILPMIQGWGMGKEYKAVVLSRIIANACWANITNYVYNIAAGRPEKNVLDPQHMLYNAFNRGNLFPFIADLSNMADSYGAGVGSALGVNNNSRYYNTDLWGKMAPGLALPGDIIKTGHSLHKILTGTATGADYYQGIRMIPGSNLPGIGAGVNQLKNNPFGGS